MMIMRKIAGWMNESAFARVLYNFPLLQILSFQYHTNFLLLLLLLLVLLLRLLLVVVVVAFGDVDDDDVGEEEKRIQP